MNDNIHPLDDFFFTCAFYAVHQSIVDGKGDDKEYSRRIAYDAYEAGKHLIPPSCVS